MQNSQELLIEGFHAVKHALRFGAEVVRVVSAPDEAWQELSQRLAPDVADELRRRVEVVTEREFAELSPRRHPTGLVAIVRRPSVVPEIWRASERQRPVVWLEDPRRGGNVGAVVRVAAAVGAGGVLVTGELDPWGADVVRGAAGLQFALPVVGGVAPEAIEGPIYAFDAGGQDIRDVELPANAILVFGTERDGVSEATRARADKVVSLPMEPGVSSLNLATSVAASLYYLRLKTRS